MNELINRLKLSQLIIGSLLIVGLIPLVLLSGVLTWLSESALEESAYNQLSAARAIKARQVQSYFAEREGDLNVLSNTTLFFYNQSQLSIAEQTRIKVEAIEARFSQINRELTLFAESYDTHQALKAFNRDFIVGESVQDNARWRINRDLYGEHMTRFQQAFDWYDTYLINMDGYILYSVNQGSELGLNIQVDPLKDTGLAEAYALASKSNKVNNYFGDLSYYPPAKDYATFIVRPVSDTNGQVMGYVALRISSTLFNRILSGGNELEQKSFLVGEDKKLRSDAAFLTIAESYQANISIATLATTSKNAGAGMIRSYDGELVLSEWQPIAVSDSVTWTLVNEVGVESALVPKVGEEQSYYEAYLAEYGYYDLFLIHPDGEIFYTVAKEPDYKTNILSGIYSNSNLGRLIQQVAKTKSYGLADFAPYAPSQNTPAAFIAIPVFSQNEVVFYAALQLSLDSINSVMQLREGMGDTGETYLVGSDYRMRSDSYIDKTGHSVIASFAGTVEHNGVKTKASISALNGLTGTEEVIDYNDNPVLSSFSPLNIGETTWAVIAEIDVVEAFQAIYKIKNVIWATLGGTILITVLFSLYLANVIRKPLGGEPREMMELAEQIADGDLTHSFKSNIKQGNVYASLYKMTTNLKALIGNILESSQVLASTAEETAVASEQTTKAVTNQQVDTEMMATAVNQMTNTISDVAKNTEHAAMASKEAHQRSLEGLGLLRKSMKSIDMLMREIQVTASDMDTLVERAQKVDEVLEVIQMITEQTNLLALNAAIEAARAGEHGRGFAVVADEVRKLAAQTQGSTSDIQSILVSVKDAASISVSNMKRSVEQAQISEKLSQQTAEEFQAISAAIEKIDEMMTQVSTASEEQAQVSEDISQRVTHINQVSIETSAVAQQLSAASQEVARSAEGLTEQTRHFCV